MFAKYFILLSKSKFSILCQRIPCLKTGLSCRSTGTPSLSSEERRTTTGLVRDHRQGSSFKVQVLDPSEWELGLEDLLHHFSVCDVFNYQVRTNLSASAESALGEAGAWGWPLCRAVQVGLPVLASLASPGQAQQSEKGAREHGSLGGFPLQPENLIQYSPSVTFWRKFRLKVFSDETPVPPSVRFESTFQLEESDVGQFR